MRKKQVWRYYCEFCGKGRCQANAIANHELHCTKNPHRQCGMCTIAEQPTPPMEWLKSALAQSLDNLLEAAGNCPACVLSAIRQSDATTDQYEWNYTTACEQFWADLKVESEKQAENEILSEMYGL